VLDYYLSEIKKGNSTPKITFEVLLDLLEEKNTDFRGKFKEKYLHELSEAKIETHGEITKNNDSLIRKVLSGILNTSKTIGGNEEHKKSQREIIVDVLSQWFPTKTTKIEP